MAIDTRPNSRSIVAICRILSSVIVILPRSVLVRPRRGMQGSRLIGWACADAAHALGCRPAMNVLHDRCALAETAARRRPTGSRASRAGNYLVRPVVRGMLA